QRDPRRARAAGGVVQGGPVPGGPGSGGRGRRVVRGRGLSRGAALALAGRLPAVADPHPPEEVRRGGPAVPPAPGAAARSRGRRADAGADPSRPARDGPETAPRVSGGNVVRCGPVRSPEGTPPRAGLAGRGVPPGDPAGTRRAETAPADPHPRLLR